MQLLDIRNMTIELDTGEMIIRAVDRVNISLKEGEVHGLVGESGSGKSLIAKALMGVLNARWRVTADRMHWRGIDLMRLNSKKRRQLIGNEIAMIYQEPKSCLDPTAKIYAQLAESIPRDDIKGHYFAKRRILKKRAIALLHKVGIKEHLEVFDSYPHELSEGICQKIMIAMAIARSPKLLIADEPTTSLESTTRAQIYRLLKSLNQLKSMSILMISHELSELSDWTHGLHVLYCGQMVESGTSKVLFSKPKHPYTQALLESLPEYNQNLKHKAPLYALKGTIPTLQHLPIGCRLGPRCPQAQKQCVFTPVIEDNQGHTFSCHFPLNESKGQN